jgi:hypothetical protein
MPLAVRLGLAGAVASLAAAVAFVLLVPGVVGSPWGRAGDFALVALAAGFLLSAVQAHRERRAAGGRRRPPGRLPASDVVARVVAGSLHGLRDFHRLRDERYDAEQEALREQAIPRLASNGLALRAVWDHGLGLAAELPAGADPVPVGTDHLQGVSEALALLGDDAYDPLLPGPDDLARWTADPQVVAWLHASAGPVAEAVAGWAQEEAGRGPLEEPEPEPAGPEREAEVRELLGAELAAQGSAYRMLVECYVDPATREIAADAAWDRLAGLARVLREAKGASCRLRQFAGREILFAFVLLHQVFASMAIIAGREDARRLLAPDELELHLAQGPLTAWS